MSPYLTTPRGIAYHATAEEVYPLVDPGSVSLVISDGPYNMRKAAWDTFASWRAFVDWYAPHMDAWDRVCAPSATVYVWGSDESEGYLRDPMRARGWTFRGSLTWDKGDESMAGKWCAMDHVARAWPDVTERCGVYQRDEWDPRQALMALAAAGYSPADADQAAGVACMVSRKWLGTDAQASPPNGEDLGRVQRHLSLGWPWTATMPRAAFELVRGCSNIWRHPQVRGAERLRDGAGTLHPCQKPLAFYTRIIRASSRPGDTVLEPFGGTCRALVAASRLPEEEARRVVCAEPERRYLDAVRASLETRPQDTATEVQPSLFGAP